MPLRTMLLLLLVVVVVKKGGSNAEDGCKSTSTHKRSHKQAGLEPAVKHPFLLLPFSLTRQTTDGVP